MRLSVIAIVCLVMFPHAVFGGLISTNSVQKLTAAADLVIVGSLTSAQQTGDNVALRLRVLRVLKGATGGLGTIHAVIDADQVGSTAIASGGGPPSIWFFARNGEKPHRLLPAREGEIDVQLMSFPARADGPTAGYAYQPDQCPDEKVALEIVSYADEQRGFGLEDELVRALQGINAPAVTRIFKRFSISNEPRMRVVGLAGLLQRGDANAALQLEKDLQGPLKGIARGNSDAMLAIAAAVEFLYRNPDPAGIAALGQVAMQMDAPSYLQRAAAYSVRAMHTAQTLPHLARMLESSNPRVRYDAVFGFASFANNLPVATKDNIANMSFMRSSASPADVQTLAYMPAAEEFEQNETKYVEFWKDWWNKNRTAF